MLAVKTIALGAVGVAALVGGTAPASAQYYPGTPYGYGYGQPNAGQVIGQVIAQVLNPYGQWGHQRGVNPQLAVSQCTRAVQHRLSTRHQVGYGQQYNPYNQYGYGNAYNQARVLGITQVQQRSATTMRVRGVATSGMGHAQYGGGYGGYGGQYGGGYAQAQAHADLSFRCDVDYRGHVRNISIGRNY
jgi:hypothetical protein